MTQPRSSNLKFPVSVALHITSLHLHLEQHSICPRDVSRATRGFQAYNILQGTLVFLKDSWRVDLPDIQAEGLTYEMLKEATVRNVPHCLAAGDISTTKYHYTKTFAYTTKPWACYTYAHFIPHRHYRLALDVIGRSLTTFESSYHLVAAVRDSLIGKSPMHL